MAGEYVVNFSDGNSFTIPPNTNDTSSTPLTLIGRFQTNFGEPTAENLVHLLENFASPGNMEPSNPIPGMLWFVKDEGDQNSANEIQGTLKVRNASNNEWLDVGFGAGGGSRFELPDQSGNFTADVNRNYFIDTSSGPVTITLPSSPEIGDTVGFNDVTSSFDSNTLTINNGSSLLMGLNEPMEVDVVNATVKLSFSGSNNGWRIV